MTLLPLRSLTFILLLLLSSQSFLPMQNIEVPKWWNSDRELNRIYPLLTELSQFKNLGFNKFKNKFLLLDNQSKENYRSLTDKYRRSFLNQYYDFKQWFQMSDQDRNNESRRRLRRIFVQESIKDLENRVKDLQAIIRNQDEIMITSYKINYHLNPQEYLDLIKEEIRSKKASRQTSKSAKSES